MIILLSVLVFIIGVVMFYSSTRPEHKRVGEIAILCGLLATLLQFQQAIDLLKPFTRGQ